MYSILRSLKDHLEVVILMYEYTRPIAWVGAMTNRDNSLAKISSTAIGRPMGSNPIPYFSFSQGPARLPCRMCLPYDRQRMIPALTRRQVIRQTQSAMAIVHGSVGEGRMEVIW